MKIEEIIQTYALALRDNDYEAMINLFAADAMIFSFQAGVQQPTVFFRNLFATTSRSAVKIKTVFFNEAKSEVAVHINLVALLDKQYPINMEVVDIFEFDSKNKIKTLRIILDTYPIRALKEKIAIQQHAAVGIQSFFRGYLAREKIKKLRRLKIVAQSSNVSVFP